MCNPPDQERCITDIVIQLLMLRLRPLFEDLAGVDFTLASNQEANVETLIRELVDSLVSAASNPMNRETVVRVTHQFASLSRLLEELSSQSRLLEELSSQSRLLEELSSQPTASENYRTEMFTIIQGLLQELAESCNQNPDSLDENV